MMATMVVMMMMMMIEKRKTRRERGERRERREEEKKKKKSRGGRCRAGPMQARRQTRAGNPKNAKRRSAGGARQGKAGVRDRAKKTASLQLPARRFTGRNYLYLLYLVFMYLCVYVFIYIYRGGGEGGREGPPPLSMCLSVCLYQTPPSPSLPLSLLPPLPLSPPLSPPLPLLPHAPPPYIIAIPDWPTSQASMRHPPYQKIHVGSVSSLPTGRHLRQFKSAHPFSHPSVRLSVCPFPTRPGGAQITGRVCLALLGSRMVAVCVSVCRAWQQPGARRAVGRSAGRSNRRVLHRDFIPGNAPRKPLSAPRLPPPPPTTTITTITTRRPS